MKRLVSVIAASLSLAWLLLPGAASALTLSPPSFDLTADPGQTLTQKLKLRNETSAVTTINTQALNFKAEEGDETRGTPDFYPADEPGDGHGMGGWISFDAQDITLLAGETVELPFQITVPKDAGPGSYYGAVVVSSSVGSGESQVGIVGNTAILVILRVNGNVVEDLKLTGFSAAPTIMASLPARFEVRVENGGTVHLRPYGQITIKNVFGRVVGVVPVNRAEYKSVLPGKARRYMASWSRRSVPKDASALTRQWQDFAFGPYTAELELEYGDEKRLLTATTRFWVAPWLVLLLLGGGAMVLILGLRHFLAAYRDRIIRRHEAAK